jgi:hypothetical protein
VSAALAEGADPNAIHGEDGLGPPLICIAVLTQESNAGESILRVLLRSGARPDTEWWDSSERGSTALMLAAQENKQKYLNSLLEAGADPNKADGNGRNAYMRAAPGSRMLLAGVTHVHELDLADAIRIAKGLIDRYRDRPPHGDPIVIEQSCANCAWHSWNDRTCIQHADPNGGGQVGVPIDSDQAREMLCEKWEDADLVALLRRGVLPTNIAYSRRKPKLVKKRERLSAWTGYLARRR